MTVILIGQYDSPFVRRVAIALRLYGIEYDHRPWSTFGDGERIAVYNPLRRVPTLVLDDGEVLIESGAILDHLDQQVDAEDALIPPGGADRRAILKVCALATGTCDKMVSLIYERALHSTTSPAWVARCELQVGAVLDRLESDYPGVGDYWFGDRPTHADIAIACMMRFLGDAHREIAAANRWPGLSALAGRCERIDAFAAVVQPFIAPA